MAQDFQIRTGYKYRKPTYKPTNGKGGASNHDTIGMLAMDSSGNLSGHVPPVAWLLKCGAVLATHLLLEQDFMSTTRSEPHFNGVGEEVIRIVGSHLVVELMRQGFKT
jgi:N4-(beta-N-acetylglucosaminyl)-L-asparaginase